MDWVRLGYDLVNRVMNRNVESEINHDGDLFQVLDEQTRAKTLEDAKKAKKKSSKSKSKLIVMQIFWIRW